MKCIEDEIPFELPEGWAWCRLSSISIIGTGATPLKSNSSYYQAGTIPWITSAATNKPFITSPIDYITEIALHKTNCTIYPKGTLIIAMYGEGKTRGQISELKISAATNQACAAVQILGNVDNLSSYIKAYFSYNYEELRSQAKGGQQPNLNQSIISAMLIPVPQEHEIARIHQTLQVYLSLVDQITENKVGISNLVIQAKSKILDLAIRGKLVPQNPNDEPASVMLERIRTEKESLIKAGKIKRDKKESVIFRGEDNSYYLRTGCDTVDISDELPYDIPENWGWERLGSLCSINLRNNLPDDAEVSFIPMPLIEDGFSGQHDFESRQWKKVKSGFTHFQNGDIGIAKITPCFENRKSVIFRDLIGGHGAGTTELHILRPYSKDILPEYILALVKSDSFINLGKQAFTGAVGQQRIGKDYVANTYIALPPAAEQKRIIAAIKSYFAQLDKIAEALA